MFSKFPHVIACVGISFLLCLSNMDVGLPGGSEVKNPLASAGDTDSILGQEDPLEKGMAFLLGKCQWTGDLGGLQSMGSLPEKVFFFCLGSPVGRGVWWATVHGIEKSHHHLAAKQQQIWIYHSSVKARPAVGRVVTDLQFHLFPYECLEERHSTQTNTDILQRQTLVLGLFFFIV